VGVFLLFLLVPFLFPSFKMIDLVIQIAIFSMLAASFDILLGYTGILSFGHGMFFGLGAYSIAFLVGKYGSPSYLNLVFGLLLSMAIACICTWIWNFVCHPVLSASKRNIESRRRESLGCGKGCRGM